VDAVAGSAPQALFGIQGATGMTAVSVTGTVVATVPNPTTVVVSTMPNPTTVAQGAGKGTNTSAWLFEGGCAGQTIANTATTTINIATTTAIQLVAGVSGKQVYICAFNVVSATSQNVTLVEGSGTACATTTLGMAGGATSTTGWQLGTNGGLTFGNGMGVVFKTSTATNAVCIIDGGAGQVSGSLTFAQF
jgi:hypothetical protein